MKNRALRRYMTQVLIYTLAFVVLGEVMDTVFNGTLVDFLYNNLPINTFYKINDNRIVFVFLAYVLGLFIISVAHVSRMSKLLGIASDSISDEEPEIFETDCPDELRVFSQRLKDFKLELKETENARELAEQQKNDLIVYLAHDLKTPLTSVIGYLSLLEETQDLPIEVRAKYVGIALDKAYRLEQLINEFFDITRLNLQTAICGHQRPLVRW